MGNSSSEEAWRTSWESEKDGNRQTDSDEGPQDAYDTFGWTTDAHTHRYRDMYTQIRDMYTHTHRHNTHVHTQYTDNGHTHLGKVSMVVALHFVVENFAFFGVRVRNQFVLEEIKGNNRK